MSRILPFVVLALGLACSKPEAPKGSALELTHQWAVKAGTSLFAQVSVATKPDTAADALMEFMPTVVHQLGEQCRTDEGAKQAGSFSVSFTMQGGNPTGPSVDPASSLGECVIEVLAPTLAKHGKDLTKLDGVQIVLYLEHAPLAP
jgi:glycerol uptake facilitator-like aquaporin